MYKHIPLVVLLPAVTVYAKPLSERQQKLEWEECLDISVNSTHPYHCSTLTVPLDYSECHSNRTIDLQLVRIPALRQPSRGSIQFNFGGPGGESRITMVELASQLLLSTGGEHDLVTFDPRGTANTIPFNCSRTEVELFSQGYGFAPGNASDVTIGQNWAHAQKNAYQCLEVERDTGEYIGTAAVARDLMSVVNALGDEDGMLRYWGFSYGTTLGATVSAMFPERLDRVILDGVQNVHEYYNAIGIVQQWSNSDQVFSAIWSTCVDAGPELCPLAIYNSSQTLEDAVWDLMWSLKHNPINVGSNASFVLDYTMIKGLLAESLYSTTSWPSTAAIVDMLFRNQTDDDLLALLAARVPTTIERSLSQALTAIANLGIQCSDRNPDTQMSDLDQIKPVIQETMQTSRFMGDLSVSATLSCNVWKLHAKERYAGDWKHIRTKYPILVIGNTNDGHTPLISAQNISASFVNSVVLEVNGYGHTSLNLRSSCAIAATSAYFVNGTLPQQGTICPVDVLPYHPSS